MAPPPTYSPTLSVAETTSKLPIYSPNSTAHSVSFFFFFSHGLAWKKVHLTTECNSKVNQSETSACNPLVSDLVASLVILFENRKGLLEVGLKLLSTFPQPPILIKDVSGFAAPSHFACAPVLFLSPCRSHKARALVWKLKTPFKCRLLVLFLSFFSVISLCVLFSHRLASCACCVTYAPLPPGSTPSVLPRDPGPVVASLKRLGEKFGATV